MGDNNTVKRFVIAVAVVAVSIVVGGQTIQPSGSGGASLSAANTWTSDQTFNSNVLIPNASSAIPSGLFLDSGKTTGISKSGAGNLILGANLQNTMDFDITSAALQVASGKALCWSSSTSANVSCDGGISRLSPTIIAIGNGTAGNTAGGYITGTASLVSLTTGTNADFLCLKADGTVLIQGSACTISSLRFKPDWKPYRDDAMAKLVKLDVGTFHVNTGDNRDPNAKSLQAGLSAESVAAIAPECAVYEDDMKTPKSYRQECVIALLVKAIQQLKK